MLLQKLKLKDAFKTLSQIKVFLDRVKLLSEKSWAVLKLWKLLGCLVVVRVVSAATKKKYI